MSHFPRPIFCCFVLLLALAVPDLGMAREKVIGVLLSQEIAPFVATLEGLEAGLGNRPVQRFFLDQEGRPFSLGGRGDALNPSQYDVLVAIGPEALRYLSSRAGSVPLVYGTVLNPRNIIDAPGRFPCGVSLNIPVEAQFSAIRRFFPTLTRLGVLFDPANNQPWFKDALSTAARMGLELIPLQVNREGGKLTIVGNFARPEAILFIPDKSIISKVVIQHVIKEAVRQGTPVVGYNQFFHESGAALNFLIDYRRVGEQVAGQVEHLLAGEPCEEVVPPYFDTRANEEVWRVMKLKKAE